MTALVFDFPAINRLLRDVAPSPQKVEEDLSVWCGGPLLPENGKPLEEMIYRIEPEDYAGGFFG